MGRIALGWVALAACYAPHAPAGSPCDSDQQCPDGLVCSPSTNTCETSTGDAPSGPWLAGYAHRKKLVVTAASDLVEFPVSVAEPADPDLAAGAMADGSDIVFTAGDATTIVASELVEFDAETGALDAWFLASHLATGASSFYVYFGGPPQTPTSPWSSRFAGVWHMTGPRTTAPDSTVLRNDAMASAVAQSPVTAEGLAGAARRYDGVDDAMDVADPANGSLDFGAASFSYSVWVMVSASVGMYDMPIYKGGASALDAGFDIELGTEGWNASFGDGTANSVVAFGTESDFLGRWVHLTVVIDRDQHMTVAYVDGQPKDAVDISTLGATSNAKDLGIGYSGHLFAGLLDEVRVYAVAVEPEWLVAEQANLADRANFIAIGPLESR